MIEIPRIAVGMIGVGGFGGYRREQLRRSGRFTLAAVADRNATTLAEVARQEGAVGYEGFDRLLSHPGLEGVVISTGADSHAELACQAMRAGLHVFIEKPLCASVTEVRRIRGCQAETGRVVGLGHGHMPRHPVIRLCREWIASGRLGTIATYEENTSHSGGLEIRAGDWRGFKDRNPGGMLFQCGVHAFHSLNALFGPVAAVQAMMRHDANPVTETADVANVLVRHRGGMIGTLNCYHVTAYCHELRVFGTKGSLFIDTHARRAWFQERRVAQAEERVEVAVPELSPEDECANLTAWHDAIRGQGAPDPSLEDGVRAVLPVFAAEIAAAERREVEVAALDAAPASLAGARVAP